MNADTASVRVLDERLEEQAELLSEGARMVPDLSPAEREELRDRVLSFLRHEITEHMVTDEQVLYPKVAERLGHPFATAAMNYDHRAIRWWIDQIAHADTADATELQRLLYGLHALIRVHLSKEEDLYVGVLESSSWPAVP